MTDDVAVCGDLGNKKNNPFAFMVVEFEKCNKQLIIINILAKKVRKQKYLSSSNIVIYYSILIG